MNSRHSSNPGRALSRIGMALAMLIAGAGSAQAQSLLELYDAARAFDAQFLSARALADSAQYKAAQADALARPSLNLGITAKRDENDLPNTSRVGSTSLSAGLQGKYALYNRSNQLTISQSQLSLIMAQADLETAEQDLIVRVAQAYFDVLGAQDALGTARASKTMISEQLASAKRNFEVGTQTITDTREAQARYDLAVATEIGAENDLRIKSVILDQLVGRSGVTPKALAVPVALPAVLPLTLDPWVAQADEMNPQVRKARLGLDAAKLEIDKARASEGVTLDLNGSLGALNARGTGAQIKGTSNNASLGVTLSMPLYTGGATQSRIKETLALEEKTRNDLDYARRFASESTKRAFFGVQSQTAQVKALEAAESSSKLALEATQLGYKVGVRVNLDVLNAQTQLFNTQQNLAKMRYDVIMTGLRLRQASGQLKPEDVSAVNQLLAK